MFDHIHNSNLIENIDDADEDEQSLAAWDYLCGQKNLSHAAIKETQRLITSNQTDLPNSDKGEYRSVSKTNVWIGRRAAPGWELVALLMDNYLLDMSNLRAADPKAMHIRFENIHPFRDGNGRTGRMLMWWHERALGLEPTLIRFEDRPAYYRWFKSKEEVKREKDNMIDYYLDIHERKEIDWN